MTALDAAAGREQPFATRHSPLAASDAACAIPAAPHELIIDSFAGGGGASLGIEMALGRSPDVAINHDAVALSMHRANHPATLHLPHNVWSVDPLAVTNGRPVGLMWASPDCKHFSKAKGGKPVARTIRDLAWVVVRWAKQVRPRVICLENVEEFRTWGPLTENGQPCPVRKGETFKRWAGELRKLGYAIEHRELRACDYGAPTIRKRMFLIARCDGRPIVWPAATHGDPKSAAVKSGALRPWRTAAEIIDWSLACPSIFLTRQEARAIGVKRPLAEATMARIAKGVKRYVLEAAEPFVIYGQQGGAVRPMDSPLHTITASRKDTNAIVAPHLMTMRNSGKPYNGADESTHTVTAGGAHLNLVAAHLTNFNTGSVGADLGDPAPTVTANSFKKRPGGAPPIGVVAATLNAYYGEGEGGRDRSAPLDEPLRTVTTENRHALAAAFLAQHNLGLVGHDARAPVSTLTATGSQQAVVSAGLVNMKGSDRRMSGPETPHPTVTAQGVHSAEVRAFLTKYYGEGGTDQSPAEPLHTVPTLARFGLVTVKGEVYEIADIGMRMLSPRELFRAQGFPDDYRIEAGADGERMTQAAQNRMCGNSVSPPVARAIVAANYVADEVPLSAPRALASAPLFEAVA